MRTGLTWLALLLLPSSGALAQPVERARRDVRRDEVHVRVFGREGPTGTPLPAPGEAYAAALECRVSETRPSPTRCRTVSLDALGREGALLQRLRACYDLRPHALPAVARRIVEERLASQAGSSIPAELSAAFGPDEVLLLVREAREESQDVIGRRRRCVGLDCNMESPPIVGRRRVLVRSLSWGWVGSGGAWNVAMPYGAGEATLHLLDLVPAGARPTLLDPARRIAFDEARLGELAARGGDALVRTVARIDAAVQAFSRGEDEPARRAVELAHREQDAAAALAPELRETLRQALAELDAFAHASSVVDPCAPRPGHD